MQNSIQLQCGSSAKTDSVLSKQNCSITELTSGEITNVSGGFDFRPSARAMLLSATVLGALKKYYVLPPAFLIAATTTGVAFFITNSFIYWDLAKGFNSGCEQFAKLSTAAGLSIVAYKHFGVKPSLNAILDGNIKN